MEYFHIDGMHENIFLPFTRQVFFFLSLPFATWNIISCKNMAGYCQFMLSYISGLSSREAGILPTISVRTQKYPYVLDPSININLQNQTGTRWSPYNSILSLIKPLHHNSTLFVYWGSKGAPGTRYPLCLNSFIFMQFSPKLLQITIGWHTSRKSWIRHWYDKEMCTCSLRLVHTVVVTV